MVNALPSSDVQLGAAEFDALFPFHVAFGADLRVTRVGRSLRKIVPQAVPGRAFDELFAPLRPAEPFAVEPLRNAGGRLYTIQAREGQLVLRGQLQPFDAGAIFLGSPWLTDSRGLESLRLTLGDFAVHDPTLDLLQALQVQQIAAGDLQRLTVQLRRQSAQLEDAARAKDTFLASISHELRTPLAGILGLSESLVAEVAGPLNERQTRYLRIIEGSGRRLLSLVNDVLDLVKIDAGQEQLARTGCLIDELCDASLQAVRPLVEKRRQTLRFEGLGPGRTLRVDARRFKQALDNLLENASKFTPENGELGLRLEATATDVRIHVWDRGIGIAESNLPKLFRPFVQIDDRRARRYDGCGLGLALVKQLVALHGGVVEVTSQLGQGTQFSIVLPASDLDAA